MKKLEKKLNFFCFLIYYYITSIPLCLFEEEKIKKEEEKGQLKQKKGAKRWFSQKAVKQIVQKKK